MKKIFVLLLFLPLAVLCTGMFSFQDDQKGASRAACSTSMCWRNIMQKAPAEWYKKSAEQGYALAQYEYAVFLERGWGGVEAGVPEAQEFLRKIRR